MDALYVIGQYHPILLHFPIVLFVAALVTDILNYFGKPRALYVGHWLVIAGVVMCIPTILTGLAASTSFDANDSLIAKHKLLGFSTAICGSLYAGLRISVMRWHLYLRPVYYLMMSVLLVILVSWTSDYGGLITRGSTPFSSVSASEQTAEVDVKGHQLQEKDLTKQLESNITVKDVIPIFVANKCAHCHAKHFPDGKPSRFYEGAPEHAFLVKDKDFRKSNFYQTVILENRMPRNHHGDVLGLTSGERLVLLMWLQNGAPMD